MKPSLQLLLPALLFSAAFSACKTKDRSNSGIADEYGMLSIPAISEKKEKKPKERFSLRKTGKSEDDFSGEW